ncbi:hypothetical protein QOZ88_05765 [Blastococcus sp. BMG 814]|uniref:Uncharacterized protein n=1 Tax=Blastococcus carthaginiensis TaxID=3050034 RepID=A0ABT9I987_9ACTN|nr:hypothetical protein [Blastococcus carthaginiensis]MDP5182136.1 hypothetical protein [Blastococcus carthaginiensis]
MDFDVARQIQPTIRGYLNAPASSLQRVPEIENESTEDAIRKLQIQVFALTDALAAATEEIERMRRFLGR